MVVRVGGEGEGGEREGEKEGGRGTLVCMRERSEQKYERRRAFIHIQMLFSKSVSCFYRNCVSQTNT